MQGGGSHSGDVLSTAWRADEGVSQSRKSRLDEVLYSKSISGIQDDVGH